MLPNFGDFHGCEKGLQHSSAMLPANVPYGDSCERLCLSHSPVHGATEEE